MGPTFYMVCTWYLLGSKRGARTRAHRKALGRVPGCTVALKVQVPAVRRLPKIIITIPAMETLDTL